MPEKAANPFLDPAQAAETAQRILAARRGELAPDQVEKLEAIIARAPKALDGWHEDDHPRVPAGEPGGGQFTDGGGGSSSGEITGKRFFTDYHEARKVAEQLAAKHGVDHGVLAGKEYDKKGYSVRMLPRPDKSFGADARAERVPAPAKPSGKVMDRIEREQHVEKLTKVFDRIMSDEAVRGFAYMVDNPSRPLLGRDVTRRDIAAYIGRNSSSDNLREILDSARTHAQSEDPRTRYAAEWDESQHPRAENGEFTDAAGGVGSSKTPSSEPKPTKGGSYTSSNGEEWKPFGGTGVFEAKDKDGKWKTVSREKVKQELLKVTGAGSDYRTSNGDLWRQFGRTGVFERKDKSGDWKEVPLLDLHKELLAVTSQGKKKSLAAGSSGCGCSKKQGEGTDPQTQRGERTMSKVAELAGALIACARSPFSEEDRANLEAFGEERLGAIVTSLAAPDPEPKSKEPEKPMSDEEWLAKAPASLRAMHQKYQAEDEDRRKRLISSLGAAQKELSTEQLGTKSTEELEVLGRLLKIGEPARDFSGRALPAAASAVEDHTPPDSYGLTKKEAN